MQGVIPNWTTGIFRPKNRSIGGIVAQVTIQEQERDELTITEHPVEQGAPINDHAFKRPSEVTIRAGWSPKSGELGANGNGVYGLLLGLQKSFQPFTLSTGKRDYPDMLIQSLTVTTDQHSEFALMAEIVCRQVIIVKTQTTQASVNSDPGNQNDPGSNGVPSEDGDQQPTDVGSGNTYTPAKDLGGRILETQAPAVDLPKPTATGAQVEKAVDSNTTSSQTGDKGFDMVVPGL